jgi:FixJ family two-component response regulator
MTSNLSNPPHPSNLSPPHPPMFIVDDEEAVRVSLAKLLKAIGVPSETFSSAVAFLSTWTPERRGCVLVDLRMPGMSGLDLLVEMRRRHIDMPIILMTGHTDERSVQHLEAQQPFGFLEKPFSIKELKGLVERWRATFSQL